MMVHEVLDGDQELLFCCYFFHVCYFFFAFNIPSPLLSFFVYKNLGFLFSDHTMTLRLSIVVRMLFECDFLPVVSPS
jgi:hypothetical protein